MSPNVTSPQGPALSPQREDTEPPGDRSAVRPPPGTLLHLALAACASVLALRVIAGLGDRPPPVTSRDRTPQQAMAATMLPPATVTPLAPARPAAAAAPPRTYFASVAVAGQQLGLRVWQPHVLPLNAMPLSVAWQADSPAPGLPPTGTLFAWYFTWDNGVMLLLAQGPSVGLAAGAAPPGEHGTASLADGRHVVWVRGHVDPPDPSPGAGRRWSGTELRVGVEFVPGEPGWWLESKVLSLDELLAVAEGLR